MHSDLFSCCLCSLEYNRSDRLPKILPTCGHTICLSCLQLILNHQPQPTCPFDRTSFRSSPLKVADFLTNLSLLQILDERTKPNQKLCKQHREPKDMVCLSDRSRICRVCSQSRHEGHKVISLKDLKAMVVQKREHLRTLVEEFNNWKERLDDEFERLKSSSVSEMFQKPVSGLVDENRVRLELDMYFTLSKIELAERLKGDIALKDRIVMQISALSDNIFSDKVMKILKDQNYQFEFRDEASPLRVFLDRFKKAVEELPYYWNLVQNRQSKQVDQDIQVLQSPQETGEDSDFAEETDNLKVDRWRNLLRVYSLEGWTCISFKGDSPHDKQDTYILNLETLGNSTRVSVEFNRDMISDDMMKVLEELLGEIYEITDLKVNFSNKNLSPQDFSRVSNSSIWDLNLQQIKSVEIDLEECPIDDNAFVFMLKRLVPNMKDLRSLELRLGETSITDAGLLEFGKQMSIGLRSLEHFNLNLYSLRIDDAVISCLFENMEAVLPNLKNFALGLSNTMISEVGVQILAESVLQRLTSVESLELYLCGIGVRDQEVQGLCAGIQAGGNKIRSLVLNLGNTQVTDHSLGMLLKTILPSVHGMEVLELYFYNTHVSCDGVQQFCKEISKQESSASRKHLRVEDLNIILSNH